MMAHFSVILSGLQMSDPGICLICMFELGVGPAAIGSVEGSAILECHHCAIFRLIRSTLISWLS